jgi:Glyoxalase-like domain
MNPNTPPLATMYSLDHLVVVAADLQEGIDYVTNILGISPQPGGQHIRMGTHNALLSMGPSCYLEVIAIDPTLSNPEHSRWFGLDQEETQQRLDHSPFLLHWVARTTDIHTARDIAHRMFGKVIPMNRNQLDWLITVPEDGSLHGEGTVPSLIQWQTETLPSKQLPDQGMRLESLDIFSPTPDAIKSVLEQMNLKTKISVHQDDKSSLTATIKTPTGIKILE